MRPIPAVLLVALVLVAATAAAGHGAPVVRCSGADAPVVLSGLPAVLDSEDVRSRLDSGLTNSLLFRVTLDDGTNGAIVGGARIQVRYELWDEEYLVSCIAGDGTLTSESLGSFDELELWLRQLQLPVLPPGAVVPRQGLEADVELSFVPFSQSEQADAQLWFTRSLGTGAGTERARGDRAAQGSVLDLLVATSITRRSLLRHTWTVPLAMPAGDGDEEDRESTGS